MISGTWAGVDVAVIRKAVADPNRAVQIRLGRDLFHGWPLIYVESVDLINIRRKPVRVLPGPIVGGDDISYSDVLRVLADVLDGTIETLVVTDPRDAEEDS